MIDSTPNSPSPSPMVAALLASTIVTASTPTLTATNAVTRSARRCRG